MPDTYSYSDDEEHFWGHAASRQAAIEDGFNTYSDHGAIYTAKNEQPVQYRVDADVLLEQLQERAFEECGGCAEDYLSDVSLGQMDRLNKAVNEAVAKWLKDEGLEPKFFHVVNVQRHDRSEHAV